MRWRNKKIKAEETGGSTSITSGGKERRERRRETYNTGPKSAHYLLLGDEQEIFALPDLNEAFIPEEMDGEV